MRWLYTAGAFLAFTMLFVVLGSVAGKWWYHRKGRATGPQPDPESVAARETREVKDRVGQILDLARDIDARVDIILDRYEADGGIVDRRRR